MLIFNWLVLADFYRLTLRNRGNGPIEHGVWSQDFRNLKIEIRTTRGPTRHWRMTYADAWYGLSWMLVFMNDIWSYRIPDWGGLWENIYRVVRKDVQPWRQIGEIQVELLQEEDKSVGNSATARHLLFPRKASSAASSFPSSQAPALPPPINFTAFDNSEPAVNTGKGVTAAAPPPPNPFPVPDSDMILIFGPPTGNPPPKKVILGSLYSFFLELYQGALANLGDPPFDERSLERPEASIFFVPRRRGDTPLATYSIIVDAILGMVVYMVRVGFMATDITIVKPDATGKRIPLGTFSIRTPNLQRVNSTVDALGTDLSTS